MHAFAIERLNKRSVVSGGVLQAPRTVIAAQGPPWLMGQNIKYGSLFEIKIFCHEFCHTLCFAVSCPASLLPWSPLDSSSPTLTPHSGHATAASARLGLLLLDDR